MNKMNTVQVSLSPHLCVHVGEGGGGHMCKRRHRDRQTERGGGGAGQEGYKEAETA